MPLDISQIVPQKGKLICSLWENNTINLPLQLFYSLEIPLLPFDTGHDYVAQPSQTSIVIEWIRFFDKNEMQEKNWRNLANRQFKLNYQDGTAEGSVYLGREHCQFNSHIEFQTLNDKSFEVELKMLINFKIDTINLNQDGAITIKTQIDFDGFMLFPMLPSFANATNPLLLISKFVEPTVYQHELVPYDTGYREWKQLKPN